MFFFFFFSSRRRHTRSLRDWSSDVCSSDLLLRASRCFSPTRDSRTNPNGVRPAKRKERKPEEAGTSRGPRRKRRARSAARKPRFLSGRPRDARCSAENVSRQGARWERRRRVYKQHQPQGRRRRWPFSFFVSGPEAPRKTEQAWKFYGMPSLAKAAPRTARAESHDSNWASASGKLRRP